MTRILFIWTFILAMLQGMAQTGVSGVVVENGSGEPLAGASVILRNSEGKIKKFTSSDAAGRFSLAAPEIKGFTLEVSMMSVTKRSIPLDSVSFPITIYMEPGSLKLKEVAVKADRIREQGDTISYNVGSFAQAQDRSIGDVLRRMPGIDVADNGRIRYQGEDINNSLDELNF